MGAQARTAIGDIGDALARRRRALMRTGAASALSERLAPHRRCAEAVAASISAGRGSLTVSAHSLATACRDAIDLRLRWLATSVHEELGVRTPRSAADRARTIWHRLGPPLGRLGLSRSEHRVVADNLIAIDALLCSPRHMIDTDLTTLEALLAHILGAIETSVELVEAADARGG